jgi:hypothetical protein
LFLVTGDPRGQLRLCVELGYLAERFDRSKAQAKTLVIDAYETLISEIGR